nr:MAG TPA: hypothetical protein [Bacteriophage sp.]DAT49986.1 MAG TPA: hypothetical protein [Caudoviricetes sp.]
MWNKTDYSLVPQIVNYVPSPHPYIRIWIVQRA